MTCVRGKRRIYRPFDGNYEVLELRQYPYTSEYMEAVSKRIRANLTGELVAREIREKYPSNHPRWGYPFFGYCVPATFTLLYLMDTDVLETMRGEDKEGEGHWWLKDKLTERIYDLTAEQFSNKTELQSIYEGGCMGENHNLYKNMPDSTIFNLIQKVEPNSMRFIVS